jgi:hypothetical protein
VDIDGDLVDGDHNDYEEEEEDELAFLEMESEDNEEDTEGASDSSAVDSTVDAPPFVPVQPEDIRRVSKD